MKNTLKAFLLVVISNSLIQSSIAQQSTFEVRGATTCGTWIKERRDDRYPSWSNERWLIGYLSGIAIARHQNILGGIDNYSIYMWMDNFCRENPIKNTAEGAQEIYLQIIKSNRLSN